MVEITPILDVFSTGTGTALLTRSAILSNLDTGLDVGSTQAGDDVEGTTELDTRRNSSCGSFDFSAMQRLSHRDLSTDTLDSLVGVVFKILTSLRYSISSDTIICVMSGERLGVIIPPKILIFCSNIFFLTLPIPVDTIRKDIPWNIFDVDMT